MIIRLLGIIFIFCTQFLYAPQARSSSLSVKSRGVGQSTNAMVEVNPLVRKPDGKDISLAKKIAVEQVIESFARDVASNKQKFDSVLKQLQTSKTRVPSQKFDIALKNEIAGSRRNSLNLTHQNLSSSAIGKPQYKLPLSEGFVLERQPSLVLKPQRSSLSRQSGIKFLEQQSSAAQVKSEVSLSNAFETIMPESTPVLKQAKAAVIKNAQEYLNHTSGQRQQAVGSLFGQRQKLGTEYQVELLKLEMNAKPAETAAAKSQVKQRIANKISEQIFRESGVEGNYKSFMQEFRMKKDLPPKELTAWLENKLNLKSGGLQTPEGQTKIQQLYENLSLIKTKKEMSAQGLFKVESAARNNEIADLSKVMNDMVNITPEVQTPTQKYLLEHTKNSQAVTLVHQLKSAGRSVEKMMAELSKAPIKAETVQKTKLLSELVGEGVQRYEVSTPLELASYIGRQPLGNSEHVLVDYSKSSRTADSLAKLNDFSAAVQADKPFIKSLEGQKIHEQLLQSVDTIVMNARDYVKQTPQQRVQAIEKLQQQNKALEQLQQESSLLKTDLRNPQSKEVALLSTQAQFTKITINRMIRELGQAPVENIAVS